MSVRFVTWFNHFWFDWMTHVCTVKYLRQATPTFISPDLWPPNSPYRLYPEPNIRVCPHLNPVDYKIWAVFRIGCTHQKRVLRDVNELSLINVWLSRWGRPMVRLDFWQTIVPCVDNKFSGFMFAISWRTYFSVFKLYFIEPLVSNRQL